MEKVTFKFKVGAHVFYNGVPHTVYEQKQTDTGKWYILFNRVGYVHETELKKDSKR